MSPYSTLTRLGASICWIFVRYVFKKTEKSFNDYWWEHSEMPRSILMALVAVVSALGLVFFSAWVTNLF